MKKVNGFLSIIVQGLENQKDDDGGGKQLKIPPQKNALEQKRNTNDHLKERN
jgi:hypothetical protein